MSSVIWSDLPRFDTGGQTPMSPQHLQILFGKLPEDEAHSELDGDQAVEAAADDAPAETTGLEQEFEDLEALMNALSGSLEEIVADSKARSVQLVQAISARLFPVLAQEFLAEEIGRHLPDLIPDLAPTIEIHVTPEFAEKMSETVTRDKILADRCRIVSSQAQDPATVEVSWQTGGINFDFEALLRACLDRLAQPQPTSEE